jgi:hypothetical protein
MKNQISPKDMKIFGPILIKKKKKKWIELELVIKRFYLFCIFFDIVEERSNHFFSLKHQDI